MDATFWIDITNTDNYATGLLNTLEFEHGYKVDDVPTNPKPSFRSFDMAVEGQLFTPGSTILSQGTTTWFQCIDFNATHVRVQVANSYTVDWDNMPMYLVVNFGAGSAPIYK